MRRADRLQRQRLLDGIAQQGVERHLGIGDLVDERGVGAVLQQAAHQIGQKRLVRADRRVDAARPVELVRSHDLLVQRLAHAVQALELVLAGIKVLAGHGVDGGERERIVRGELRKRRVGRGQQPARAGEVGHVGMDAPREHRIAFQSVELGALDLAVPVGALDQPHHQPAMRAARQIDQPVDREERALLVGLHDEADAVPAFELGLEAEPLQEIERDLQPIGLLGIDVEPDVVVARQHGQRP